MTKQPVTGQRMTKHAVAKPKADASAARVSALAGELGTLIGRLKRRLREQASAEGLSLSQISVLARLDRAGPATVTALARSECMRPQSMGAMVSTLETAGLVSGAADPDDGRQTIWSLTPACRERIKTWRTARQDWLFRAIQSRLTPNEQDTLAQGLELLKRVVDS